jgi:hypothetical protein
MTPEEHAKLERALALAEENNKILLSIRRSNRIALGMRALYWVVILGLTFGAFYFIQPYLNFLTNLGGGSISQPSGQTTGQSTSTDSSLLSALKQAQQSAHGLEDLLK